MVKDAFIYQRCRNRFVCRHKGSAAICLSSSMHCSYVVDPTEVQFKPAKRLKQYLNGANNSWMLICADELVETESKSIQSRAQNQVQGKGAEQASLFDTKWIQYISPLYYKRALPLVTQRRNFFELLKSCKVISWLP